MTAPPAIGVVDTGAGNLKSVLKALERARLAARVVRTPEALLGSDALVLPGVGAFADAAGELRSRGLDAALGEAIAAGRPYLGLCLGLQLLFDESSEHGRNAGLGILPGRVERFTDRDEGGAPRRVPHIGWNRVSYAGDHPLLRRLPAEDCYYFVHSYRALPARREDVAGWVDYGERFAGAVARDNVFAVQFHPEKSQAAGRRLLDAFAAWLRE